MIDVFPKTSKLKKVPSTYSHERTYVKKGKLQLQSAWTSMQVLLATVKQ